MEIREVIIIGDGLAGLATASELIKQGIAVSIVATSDMKESPLSHMYSVKSLQKAADSLQQLGGESLLCPRAYENMISQIPHVIKKWLSTSEEYVDVHGQLYNELRNHPKVEWLFGFRVFELLILEKHSQKPLDCYKKPACFGVRAFSETTQSVTDFLAKETIIATGGASSLYPHTAHLNAFGCGIAWALAAKARLLNMGDVSFYPLGLSLKNGLCLPLPLDFLSLGAKIILFDHQILEVEGKNEEELLTMLYDALLQNGRSSIKIDCSLLENEPLSKEHLAFITHLKTGGIDLLQEPQEITPYAIFTSGGIAVDKAAQSSIQRLRAVGESTATGFYFKNITASFKAIESLVFAISCAEDVSKMIQKFAYYFPEIKAQEACTEGFETATHAEEWSLLKQIMWFYAGIKGTSSRAKKGAALIESLKKEVINHGAHQNSLLEAIQVALLILKDKVEKK